MAETIRVMMVDDSAETRDSLRLLLGFSDQIEVVAEAMNGVDALEKLAHLDLDVVLIDVNMPVMDGLTATERICRLHKGVAVIVISAQDDPDSVAGAMAAGARSYLTKPVSLNELIATVETAYGSCLQERRTRSTTSPSHSGLSGVGSPLPE